MTASSSVALRSRVRGKRNASYRGSTRARGGLGRRSCRGHRGRGPPAAPTRRRLHRQGALPERRPAGEGQPRADRRRADRHGEDDRPHRRRPGRGHDEARGRLRAAAPRHARHDPPGLAVRRRQPLHRPAHGAPERREDPRRRRARAGRDDHGRRPRPALQHLRPADAQGALRRHPRLRRARSRARASEFNEGIAYLNPSLAASSRLFRELNRDTPLLERFIVSSSQLVTDIADRRDDLAGLVDDLATTTTAIGNQKAALAESIGRLPGFQRRANTTFVNLRAALDDLDPLVEDSKPVAKKLRPFLAELRPLARDARPTLRDLSDIVKRPGAANDLIELMNLQEPLRDITTRKVAGQRQGARRRVQGEPGRAQGRHARVRLLPPLHARPARLVRRLQPLRHL